MISDSDVKAQLKSAISNMTEMPIDKIDEDAHLADIGIDSLQALQLLVLMERTYQVSIAEEDLKHFKSINTLSGFVSRLASKAAVVRQ
jgi:acyl carrier protein